LDGTTLAIDGLVRVGFLGLTMWLSACLPSWDGGIADGVDAGKPANDLATVDVVAEFNRKIAPILGGTDGKSGSCGACHSRAGGVGPGFLEAKPDMLTNMLGYPGVIGRTPPQSRIYAKGIHEGPALAAADAAIVADWISVFNSTLADRADSGVVRPQLPPFQPIVGDNTIDLAHLDLRLANHSLNFTAKMVGSSIQLSNVTIHTPSTSGVHLVHPLWVSWTVAGDALPDPVDSFATLDAAFDPGVDEPLGPGIVILPSFPVDGLLNVVFEVAEPIAGGSGSGSDGGTLGGCKAPAQFGSTVRPILATQCYNCHASGAGGYAMSAALSDDDLCLAARGEINLGAPTSSRLYTYPDPGMTAAHTGANRKLSSAAYADFVTALNSWIAAEK